MQHVCFVFCCFEGWVFPAHACMHGLDVGGPHSGSLLKRLGVDSKVRRCGKGAGSDQRCAEAD